MLAKRPARAADPRLGSQLGQARVTARGARRSAWRRHSSPASPGTAMTATSQAQTPVHDAHPDKDAYLTECSGGEWDPKGWAESLRWFTRELIIGSTRGWSRGIVLWNLALDEKSRPARGRLRRLPRRRDDRLGDRRDHAQRRVLRARAREPLRRPGAHRIESTTGVKGLESVAFQNADDGSMALIVLNGARRQRQVLRERRGRSRSSTRYRPAPSRPSSGIRSSNRKSRDEAPT